MILKLALRNIIGNGWRSLINMIILAIVMIGMIWMQAMYHSWIKLAETEAREWEIGQGQWQQKNYDKYDAFSWDDSHAEIPAMIAPAIKENLAVPILLTPAVIYPHGRVTPVVVKGIPAGQTILKIPSGHLQSNGEGYVNAIMGTAMAKSCRVSEGDIFSMRIKDSNGSFNAMDLKLVKIMNTPVISIDAGQVWIDLEALQDARILPNRASIIVSGVQDLADIEDPDWKFNDIKVLLADLYKIQETEEGQQYIMFALLLFLGMIAIFDTQILALFKRRKEIGTLSALGMKKSRIIMLFTTEGVLYMVFSVFFTALLGFPVFWYFAVYGYRMPAEFTDVGMPGMSDAIRFSYPANIIIGTIVFVFVLTAIVSWIPSARIARMKPTEALRGKL